MAILKNGPNGGLSGKFGSVVGYPLNGQDIVRGLPKKRRKKAGAREQANRDKFGQMQMWLRPLLEFLRIGFKGYAPTFQGFVAAKSYNSKHAFVQQEDGSFFIDPALALVSYGPDPLPIEMSMKLENNEIVFNWSKEGSYSGSDQAMLLVYIPGAKRGIKNLAAARRIEGTAKLQLPKFFAGKEVHAYIAFVRYDQSSQTNSFYLGSVTP
ncbi:MAG: hypothetical protein EOO90_24345 [Pedobacter sp.]|nr:MAG: hypothetical protein EOO90_24345 [Pedobacter sp.]